MNEMRVQNCSLVDVELKLQFLQLVLHPVFVLVKYLLRLHRNEGSGRSCELKMQA